MLPQLTPSQAQLLTLVFIVVMSLLVVGYDVLVIQTYGADASISRVLRKLFVRSPVMFSVLLLWIGILLGHLFPP